MLSFFLCVNRNLDLFTVLLQEDLPSLSIVNVSEWIGRRRSLYKADSRASLNDACVSFTKQSKDSEMIRRLVSMLQNDQKWNMI